MIYSKFETVPCCVFKDGFLLKYNDRFKIEFKDILDYLLKIMPSFIEIKDTLMLNKKTYTVYVLHESDNNQTTYVFFDITELSNVLNNKGILEISDFGMDSVPEANIKIIDKQHLEIIKLIEDINRKYKQNSPLETIVNLLFTISHKTDVHFKTEETLIRKFSIDNKETTNHIEDHERLLSQIRLMINQLSHKNINTIINYLRCWFLDHIIEHDLLLGKELIEKGCTE